MGGAARRRPHQAALASGSRTSIAPCFLTILQATETYLDAASTTPLHPDARKALEQAVDAYGDPARLYGRARRARLLLDQSRERVAAALGARADEVVFTSGGTEAANLAVAGMARGARRRRHLVVSAVEHTAVLAPARLLEPQGFEVTEVGVDHYGRVDPAELAAAVRDDTLLVCLQHANHEVGAVQPVREAAEAAHAHGAALLVDACQAVGRLQDRAVDLGADLVAVSAHKCYGPPSGCGRGSAPSLTWWSTATRASACRTWSPSACCTSRARRCCCCWTARASRCTRGPPAPPTPRSRRTCWRRWARSPTGRCGRRSWRTRPRLTWTGCSGSCPARSRTCARWPSWTARRWTARAGRVSPGERAARRGGRLPRGRLPHPRGAAGRSRPQRRGRAGGRAARRRPWRQGRHPRLVPPEGPGVPRPRRPPRGRLELPRPPPPLTGGREWERSRGEPGDPGAVAGGARRPRRLRQVHLRRQALPRHRGARIGRLPRHGRRRPHRPGGHGGRLRGPAPGRGQAAGRRAAHRGRRHQRPGALPQAPGRAGPPPPLRAGGDRLRPARRGLPGVEPAARPDGAAPGRPPPRRAAPALARAARARGLPGGARPRLAGRDRPGRGDPPAKTRRPPRLPRPLRRRRRRPRLPGRAAGAAHQARLGGRRRA